MRHALTARILAIAVLVALAGAGGYVAGAGSGEDLPAARAAGARQGSKLATVREYRKGYRSGRAAGYRETYRRAYVRAYTGEFDAAGLARPKAVRVPDARVPPVH